jgi:hypothetical protein
VGFAVVLVSIVSLRDSNQSREVRVISPTTVTTARSVRSAVSLPSRYLFEQISVANGSLYLFGEIADSTSSKCASTTVDPQTLQLGQIREASCNDPTAHGQTVGVVNTYLQTSNSATIRVARADPHTGHVSNGPVVMTYDNVSDTKPVSVVGGKWLWIYDVATTKGAELLQVSAASGKVVNTVSMPLIYRPLMAANDDGLWLGPLINGGAPAALYHVASGSKAATVVVSGHDSVCWLVGSGHDLWVGSGPTCLQQTIRRYRGSDPRPVFAVPDHGYAPNNVVGSETDGLWTMQWVPPPSATIQSASRLPQEVVRIDPDTGSERVVARLPGVAFSKYTQSSSGLLEGQAAYLNGELYLLEPPFRQGGYRGYSTLIRVALSPPSAPTSPTPSGCAISGFSTPSWPKSATLASVAAADAPATARQFIATELGIGDVAAVGGLKVRESACTVHVRVGKLEGDVNFIALSTRRYVVEGFNLGEISGTSINVTGRHLEVSYDTKCGACTSWEGHVRYGDAVTSVGPARSSHMTAELRGDPSVSGGYLFVDRLADGSIWSAHAATIPPGDFAAS